jgi:hypothetical protein
MLDADFASSRIGVASEQHLGIEHCIEDRVAMNFGAMVVSQLRGFSG